MRKILSLAVAAAAVIAMTASADAKGKKSKHMRAAGSAQMHTGWQGHHGNWGWNSSQYMFKGDRYDFSGTYGPDMARRADARQKR